MADMTTSHGFRPEAGRIPEFSKGDRYRKAREMAGFGSAEFADLIGVSRNTVSAIEGDRTNVRRIVANAWGMATGVPVTWLETGKAPSPGGDGASMLPHLDSNQKPADKRGKFASVQVTALEDLRRRSPGILPMRQVEAA